ncbi:15474_t:CDS:1, partial [Racocetra persica]
TQTDNVETMVQMINQPLFFDLEKYHDMLKDIINKKVKSETGEFIQEYKNDLRKLDCAFFKLKPKHIFFSPFKKLKMITLDKFGILEKVIDT